MKMKIGILGAESTGKSTLAEQLASHFSGTCVPEYARWYVENHPLPYGFADVEAIARKQIEQLKADYDTDYVFFDTELIITKVWFADKYGVVPQWLDQAIHECRLDFCLLCMPDLPFQTDPVRENPDRREYLTSLYEYELNSYNIPYSLLSGKGEVRLNNAIRLLE
ncbi:MAG: ATP-binding protein [Paludibacteraceae bacterium]|nr:ATP-binding protein [Paludibacteraceae bacterium]